MFPVRRPARRYDLCVQRGDALLFQVVYNRIALIIFSCIDQHKMSSVLDQDAVSLAHINKMYI